MLFPVQASFLYWSVAVLFVLIRFKKNRRSLPPGPLSLPFIGNLRYLISRPNWLTYTDWCREYDSDIVYFNIAGTSYIILNSLEAATELLERRSGIYSSRPKFRMLNDDRVGDSIFLRRVEVLTAPTRWKWSFVSMPYGPEWKAHRKLVTNMFNPNNPDEHEPRELKATRILLLKLHKSPDDLFQHLLDMAGSTILSAIYGFDVAAVQRSSYIETSEQAVKGFLQATVPGNFLVDDVPWLKYMPSWVPGTSFQGQVQLWRESMESALNGPYDEMKNHFFDNGPESCLVSRCLAKASGEHDEDSMIKQVAATMYFGGTDTTVTTLKNFLLAMVQFPESQKKAQQELDRVVGKNRLPDFTDRNSLPYIGAILYETMRWQPTAPEGLSHAVTQEDLYKGYRIPKNSTVIPNIWAMMHDEQTFEDPFTFNPDRYIRPADGQLDHNLLKTVAISFGFGRRICAGKHMALSATWIVIASILSVFDISRAVDENGEIIEPSMKLKPGTLLQNQPSPYKLSIKLRSPECLHVMQTDVDFVEGQ
ncbi:cytochrome P450 [Lentinula raphanica]|nr:cytochrome P450 [Lentinula raphanica]